MTQEKAKAVVFSSLNVAEAEFIASLLASEGIWCEVPQRNIGILNVGYSGHSAEVRVFQEDRTRAEELLERLRSQGASGEEVDE